MLTHSSGPLLRGLYLFGRVFSLALAKLIGAAECGADQLMLGECGGESGLMLCEVSRGRRIAVERKQL